MDPRPAIFNSYCAQNAYETMRRVFLTGNLHLLSPLFCVFIIVEVFLLFEWVDLGREYHSRGQEKLLLLEVVLALLLVERIVDYFQRNV